MKYDIISADTPDHMVRKVNDAVSLGWKPSGGPIYSANERCWLQAMTKQDAPPIQTKLTGK